MALGSNLPPGVSTSMIPGCGLEGPCAVCSKSVDDCVCPECPHCRVMGEPTCFYDSSRRNKRQGHGMRITREIVVSRQEARVRMLEAALADQVALLAQMRDGDFSDDLADNPDPWR